MDILQDAQRRTIRMTVLALATVVGVALFASNAARRQMQERQPEAQTAAAYPEQLRDEAERFLERHVAVRQAGRPMCSTRLLGADPPPGRRLYLWAHCEEFCPRDGVLHRGTATSFPVAVLLSREPGGGAHAIGFEAPTDAHYATDLTAIFPDAIRRRLQTAGGDADDARRASEKAAQRFGMTLAGSDPSACSATPTSSGGR